MASAAAKQVKAGFFIAAGFWVFGLVALLVLSLSIKAIIK